MRKAVFIVVGVEGGGADLDDVAIVVVREGGSGYSAWIGFKSSDGEVVGRPICRGTFAPTQSCRSEDGAAGVGIVEFAGLLLADRRVWSCCGGACRRRYADHNCPGIVACSRRRLQERDEAAATQRITRSRSIRHAALLDAGVGGGSGVADARCARGDDDVVRTRCGSEAVIGLQCETIRVLCIVAEVGEASAVVSDARHLVARTRGAGRRFFDGYDDQAIGVAVGGV